MKSVPRLLFFALLAASASLYAETFNLTFPTSSSDLVSPAFGNYYVGPYKATANGVDILIFCDDFSHRIDWGESWEANSSAIEALDLRDTRWGAPVIVHTAEEHIAKKLEPVEKQYRQAAYLANEILNATAHDGHSQEYWRTVYQWALWEIFDDNAASELRWEQSEVAKAKTDAIQHADSPDFDLEASRWRILTDTDMSSCGSGGVQEFLTRATVPEPASIMLLGTCLLAVATILRKRARSL